MRLCQQEPLISVKVAYPCLFHVALFQDLGHNVRRVLCTKLILEDGVGGSVECALSSMSRRDVIINGLDGGGE